MPSYHLGALPAPKDSRDFLYKDAARPIRKNAFADSEEILLDYSKDCGDVRNQGSRGSCVAFAMVAVKKRGESGRQCSTGECQRGRQVLLLPIPVP